MAQVEGLRIPLPAKISPHRDMAARRNLDWLHLHGMLRGPEAVAHYARWDVADLAARNYPHASAADLTLAVDLHSFFFLFDDQFDGPLGQDPARAADICDRLIGIVHGESAEAPDSPITAAFTDLWNRSVAGMSTRWRTRAAYNWEWYFASYPNEAVGRRLSTVPDRESYLMLRRGAGAGETVIDMIERLGHFEVPPAAFHSPQLRLMRQIACDVPTSSNDVVSYDKEAPRGDVNNLVTVLSEERGCSVEKAAGIVRDEVQQMIDRFVELAAEVPALCDRLGVTGEPRTWVERYADGLALWLRGYLDWERTTLRYRPDGSLPADRPNHLEQLLHPHAG
jgi:hypothetical protein